MRSNSSLSWQKLQDVYYSMRTCYDGVKWPFDNLYSNFRVAVSSPLTALATASKLVPYPNVIDIYSISGLKLMSIVYNSSLQDHIVGFCFHHENLCVVLSNQKFRLYTDFNGTFNEYSYSEALRKLTKTGDEAGIDASGRYTVITNLENNEPEEPFHILQSYVWGDYLVLRNRDKLLFTNLIDFSNYEVRLAGLDPNKQNEVCFISSANGSLAFIMSYSSTIYKFQVDFADESFEMIDQKLTDGPFLIISASPNASLIALLNEEVSKIFVITKDFDRILLEYDTSNESSSPYLIEWSGNDAIVLSLRDEIKLIGPRQQSISFFYDIIEHEEFSLDSILVDNGDTDLSFVIPLIKSEEDGLKIISKNKVEFLSRVADCSVQLHLVGSSHPSSILLDCVDKLALQASKADSNISLLKSERLLDVAIRSCLEAALEEFQPVWQQKILKAASFGKIYDDDNFNADRYLRIIFTVKVLNQLRAPEIGLFLTYSEVVDTGWPAIIRMLLMRSQHLLAIKVVDLLKLEDCRGAIYTDWCLRKIKKEIDMLDVDLFVLIAQKLLVPRKEHKRSVHYCSISEVFDVSFQEGRVDLCKLLMNLEPSGPSRMRQLLRINEAELALVKCFQSCDYDLCRLLFLHFRDTLPLLEIFQIINQNEIQVTREANIASISVSHDFLKPFVRESVFVSGDLVGTFFRYAIASTDSEMLNTFLKYEDKHSEKDIMLLKSIRDGAPAFEEGEDKFENVYQWYKSKSGPLKANKKLKKVLDVENGLLDLQYRLSNIFQESFFEEKSVIAIIKKLVRMYQIKQASKIVKEIGLSQEKLWNIVLEVYSKNHDFDRLHKFVAAANTNNDSVWKSPIGFVPIVETCLAYGSPKDLASTYIGYCTDIHFTQRVALYMKNDNYSLAAKESYSHKDPQLLKQILEKTSDEDVIAQTKVYLKELGY